MMHQLRRHRKAGGHLIERQTRVEISVDKVEYRLGLIGKGKEAARIEFTSAHRCSPLPRRAGATRARSASTSGSFFAGKLPRRAINQRDEALGCDERPTTQAPEIEFSCALQIIKGRWRQADNLTGGGKGEKGALAPRERSSRLRCDVHRFFRKVALRRKFPNASSGLIPIASKRPEGPGKPE
ncbi:hypothetical protein [Ancylobacter amanitiformis]|uniref:Uncharacterized protein n=1 Tax=Ancylobacter amanitiformis TaxID=217069 RepID=A0ABU0LXM0_9HYPH|nr:hypothetical protein [Ancylobacter amanitiformis]MDQ0513477.1 hypothetical protein [Ancylobacter amanitiformis]